LEESSKISAFFADHFCQKFILGKIHFVEICFYRKIYFYGKIYFLTDIMDGNKKVILGLIWRLITMGMLSPDQANVEASQSEFDDLQRKVFIFTERIFI
jgi:hypothetical protein